MTETYPHPLDDAALDATWGAVLEGFLDRPRLHHGEHAVAPLDAQERINLAAALAFTPRRLAQ